MFLCLPIITTSLLCPILFPSVLGSVFIYFPKLSFGTFLLMRVCHIYSLHILSFLLLTVIHSKTYFRLTRLYRYDKSFLTILATCNLFYACIGLFLDFRFYLLSKYTLEELHPHGALIHMVYPIRYA
jgi:uncharacterized membrane protein